MKLKKSSRVCYDDEPMLITSSSDDDDVPVVVNKSRDDCDNLVRTRKNYGDSLVGKDSRNSNESVLSTSSDDDDEPLVKKKRRDRDLYSYSLERCAICDSVFNNKYDILVHNSQHIIIPLLKLQVHKCSECSRNFSSQDTLNHHKETKHDITVVPDLLESIVKKQPVIKCLDDLSELLKSKTVKVPAVENLETQAHISLQSMVKTQPIVKCFDDLAELFKVKKDTESVPKKPTTKETDLKVNLSLEDIVKTKPVVKCYDDLTQLLKAKRESVECVEESDTNVNPKITLESLVESQPIVKCDNSVTELINNNIRSRLFFEDDIEDETDIRDDIVTLNTNDDLTGLKVDFGMLNGLKRDSLKPETSEPVVGKIFLGSKIPGSEARQPSVTNFAASVHYDDLMVPGVHGCKRCSKIFHTRIQAITHEATHMKIVKLRKGRPFLCYICERFISGNYRNLSDHITEVHPNRKKHNSILTPCMQCGLKYHNYERHVKNYHTVYGCPCGDRFLTNKELVEHEKTCDKEKKENVENNVYSESLTQETCSVVKPNYNGDDPRVIKLCEVCVMFKSTSHVFKYVRVGELSEVGTRQRCEGCDKEFFNIKLMKQVRRKRPEPDRSECKKSHCNTNENRLKHIQKRLKLLNKLTRF